MLSQQELKSIINKTGAIVDGGVEPSKLLQYPQYADLVCGALAWKLRHIKADVVLGLLTGSVMAARDVARALNLRVIYGEKRDNQVVLLPNFELKAGEKVLIIEDLINTGTTVKQAITMAKAHGGDVVGVGTIVDYQHGEYDFSVPTESLFTLEKKNFAA
jgi:orotate phosphoribosyltransferase